MKLLIFSIFCFVNFSYASHFAVKVGSSPPYGGLYNRLQRGDVVETITHFIQDNLLTNCFVQRIHQELLSLKCQVDEEIKEVIIKIMPEYLHYV